MHLGGAVLGFERQGAGVVNVILQRGRSLSRPQVGQTGRSSGWSNRFRVTFERSYHRCCRRACLIVGLQNHYIESLQV